MEKKCLSKKQASFDFQPAQLRVHAEKWRIEFWAKNPSTGEMERHRPTFNLNRISSEKERKRHAERIIKRLNDEWLPGGYPHRSPEQIEAKTRTVGEAVTAIFALKATSANWKTASTYKSAGKLFMEWMVAQKLDTLDVKAFRPVHAIAYAEHLVVVRKVGPTFFNSTINRLAEAFKVLIKREEIDRNPFAAVDRKKRVPKQRRIFSPTERVAMAEWVRENDWWLFIAILCEYYLFIRWEEMRRLRFADFTIGGDTAHVNLSADKTKNGRKRTVTIPDAVRHYFADARFSACPANWFVFGAKLEPGPTAAGHNQLGNRHKKAVLHLVKAGAIADGKNLTMYSWKDTGITRAGDLVEDFMEVVDQADHRDPRQTMDYRHAPKILPGFKRRADDLFQE